MNTKFMATLEVINKGDLVYQTISVMYFTQNVKKYYKFTL